MGFGVFKKELAESKEIVMLGDVAASTARETGERSVFLDGEMMFMPDWANKGVKILVGMAMRARTDVRCRERLEDAATLFVENVVVRLIPWRDTFIKMDCILDGLIRGILKENRGPLQVVRGVAHGRDRHEWKAFWLRCFPQISEGCSLRHAATEAEAQAGNESARMGTPVVTRDFDVVLMQPRTWLRGRPILKLDGRWMVEAVNVQKFIQLCGGVDTIALAQALGHNDHGQQFPGMNGLAPNGLRGMGSVTASRIARAAMSALGRGPLTVRGIADALKDNDMFKCIIHKSCAAADMMDTDVDEVDVDNSNASKAAAIIGSVMAFHQHPPVVRSPQRIATSSVIGSDSDGLLSKLRDGQVLSPADMAALASSAGDAKVVLANAGGGDKDMVRAAQYVNGLLVEGRTVLPITNARLAALLKKCGLVAVRRDGGGVQIVDPTQPKCSLSVGRRGRTDRVAIEVDAAEFVHDALGAATRRRRLAARHIHGNVLRAVAGAGGHSDYAKRCAILLMVEQSIAYNAHLFPVDDEDADDEIGDGDTVMSDADEALNQENQAPGSKRRLSPADGQAQPLKPSPKRAKIEKQAPRKVS